jgi:hypothetical protein
MTTDLLAGLMGGIAVVAVGFALGFLWGWNHAIESVQRRSGPPPAHHQ